MKDLIELNVLRISHQMEHRRSNQLQMCLSVLKISVVKKRIISVTG
jgi:hypothetical protein